MPIQINLPTNFKVPTWNLYTYLNIGIVLCTFVESYVFPFAIIKWMVLVTKYGGLLGLHKKWDEAESPVRSRYHYTLQLETSYTNRFQIGYAAKMSMSHLSVVVETERDVCIRTQLTYCGQDSTRIPPALWKMYGAKVQYLDLSFNIIEGLKGLELFPNLEELILDNNKLKDTVAFPRLAKLKTLSLNNNQITDLEGLIEKIQDCFPSLTYLSILSNKACPNQLSDREKDESDYKRYRYYVIYKLPDLIFLDSCRVSRAERAQAALRGEFTRVRRPPPTEVIAASVPNPERPLPLDLASLGKHKGAYGKCQYRYTGKHSEGNRFIVNSDL